IGVFAENLRNLLLQPPVMGERVLAIDPGFRTGCKTALLDEYGNCLANDVVYVTGSADKRAAGLQKLEALLKEHECRLIAIGNGTACRETEELISELIESSLSDARYLIVNEAGASIYSTSTVAREEFPDLDATVRGTISIGRRLQDPLSELVKIEAQHIGVGLYQHDLNSRRLKESLDEVVESCVNYVGVDLNTASASLLRYVSGFNQLIARRVVEWRERNGRFATREQLKDVSGIGEATFTQSAGFLKIGAGDELLDATWIHPESYPVTRQLIERLEILPEALSGPNGNADEIRERFQDLDLASLAAELHVGEPTLKDILDALARPGRDPRSDLPEPIYKRGILKLDDLHEDMELRGTVLNVVDFGAFVDVGLKDSGLVHISQLANRYVKSPHELVSVGDVVTVWVLGIDEERKRVSLSMIPPKKRKKKKRKRPAKPAAAVQPSQSKPQADTPTAKQGEAPAVAETAVAKTANAPDTRPVDPADLSTEATSTETPADTEPSTVSETSDADTASVATTAGKTTTAGAEAPLPGEVDPAAPVPQPHVSQASPVARTAEDGATP
ncbi:MAG: helix-hairpin-helix domain-containing protein, partial [Planctomycetaceae bacterium]